MNYWLMKTEPSVFSFEMLMKAPQQTTPWEGVRNYQARNYMRDEMKRGDKVLFYHSSCPQPGVYGLAKITQEASPDFSAGAENHGWCLVHVSFEELFPQPVLLSTLRETKGLESMVILRKGNRLSITPITEKEFSIVCLLGRRL